MGETPAPGANPRAQAFERWVLPEVDMLLRVATALTGQLADAEDLVQDTLIRAYRAVDRFDGSHPRAWLLTILRNAHVNRTRRKRPSLLHDPERALEGLAATPAEESPEDIIVGDDFVRVVGQAVAALPTRYRQVVELVDVHGLSYGEAAEALGVPRGTVMSRLHRARRRVRTRLVAAGLAPRPSRRPGGDR